MTTSFTRTRLEIARRTLSKVTKKSPAEASAASAELITVNEALDLRLKELHKLGLFWRKVTTVPVTFSLAANIATASAGAGDILFPLKVTFTNGSLDEPVGIINYRQYAEILDKGKTGDPEQVVWKGGSEFLFYPVPTANGTAKLLYEKIADDTTAGSAIDIDVSMIRAFVDVLKYDLADDYGVSEQIQERWRVECEKGLRDIQKLGAPRVDACTVAVDDWTSPRNTESDYGR